MFRSIPFWVLLIATFISWAAWGVVINKMSPFASPRIAVPAFYITSFMSLLTTFSVVGTLLRKFSSPSRNLLRCINISLRQGAILSCVSLIALFFQQARTFNLWVGALLLLIGIILESMFWDPKG